jgi:Kef-type K+ transport system membrane component KefB
MPDVSGHLLLTLAIAIATAALLATVFKMFKQPMLVAYVIAGLLIGYFSLGSFGQFTDTQPLMEIGVTLLLFLIGLELNTSELRSIFTPALANTLVRAGLLGSAGYLAGPWFGFNHLEGIFFAIILFFSSTIVGVKLLGERGTFNSQHGKLGIGTLILQDILAILVIAAITGLNAAALDTALIGTLIAKAILLIGLVFWLAEKRILSSVFRSISGNVELTFVVALAWALGLAAIASSPLIGLSPAVGGFLAGLSLSTSWERFEIGQPIKPLRDLFILFFFIMTGIEIASQPIAAFLLPALAISLGTFIVGMAASYLALGFSRQTLAVRLQTAALLSSLCEFGLITANLGYVNGQVSQEFLATITLATVISMVLSVYWYRLSFKFAHLSPRRKVKRDKVALKNHIVLIGAHRLGTDIIKEAKQHKLDLVILEQDPKIYARLETEGHNVLLGNANSWELLEEAGVEKAKTIINTSPIPEENKSILHKIRTLNPKAATIMRASYPDQAVDLYAGGADLVIIPPLLGSLFLGDLVGSRRTGKRDLARIAREQGI